MDELIDILDSKGNFTGKTAMKSKAHELGLFHPTVHLWCYSNPGNILLQQRAANKDINPLLWDVSVAGHIGAGESPETGVFREAQEEIGVTVAISKLEKIGVFPVERKYSEYLWDREFTHTFLYELEERTALTKQKSEVEALEWMHIDVFETRIKANDPRFVPNSKERYLSVLNEIRLRL